MRTTLAVLAATLLMALGACTTAPPPRPVVVAPPGVTLPLPARVFYEIAPSQREFNVSSRGPTTWVYPEGRLMREAAMPMMRDLFADPAAAETRSNGIVFQLSGASTINPAVSRYNATAVADVFLRTETSERLIGQFRGTGSAQGRIFSERPLQEAYAIAFSELSRQILADAELMRQISPRAQLRMEDAASLSAAR